MTVETGLVIVGGADDQLRLTNKKKRAELVTQTMVDKNIIEQIRTFLVGIMIKQTQAAMERGDIMIVSSYICCHLSPQTPAQSLPLQSLDKRDQPRR